MITVSPSTLQPDNWQKQLAQALTDPERLLDALRLPANLLPAARMAAAQFPLRVTAHYLSLIEAGDIHDPLLRQILPLAQELVDTPGFSVDPVGDRDAALGAGLLQKYQGRALLITTGACAIHCRYCFRRNYPYAQDNALRQWRSMLDTLSGRDDIHEVILSGGDPLSLSDARLDELLSELEAIGHLKRLRLHTRLPVVLPDRITDRLIAQLSSSRLDTVMVLHCNHPAELSPTLKPGLDALRRSGVHLLNQSVLLAGVNDSLPVLAQLSEKLFQFGVLPYYLHLLDRLQGTAHFEVSEQHALTLIEGLRARLSGFLVPKLVREIPGANAKTPVDAW